MSDPFVEFDDPAMSRTAQSTRGDALSAAGEARDSLAGKPVCPFCGQQKAVAAEPCPRCTMEDTPATRQATKARIGPWYVLQHRSPSAPGMKYSTLLWLVAKGQVTPKSIVRGPTTYQLWRWAAHVRGVSREFGLCYSCGGAIEKAAEACAHCGRSQEPPSNPDVLLESRDAGATRAPVLREVAQQPRRGPDRDIPSEADNIDEVDPPTHRAREASAAMRTPPPHAELSAVARQQRAQELIMRQANGDVVNAMELAAAFHDPRGNLERTRRFRAARVLLTLLLLTLVAAAAVMYLRPDYRKTTIEWGTSTWESIKMKVAALEWNTPPDNDPAPPRRLPPPPVLPSTAPSATRTVNDPAARPATAQPPKPQTQPPPNPTPESPRPVRDEPLVEKPPPAMDDNAAIDRARALWGQAIDAEARGDYPAAVERYEQIKKLPQHAWPGGLQISLDLARKRAASN